MKALIAALFEGKKEVPADHIAAAKKALGPFWKKCGFQNSTRYVSSYGLSVFYQDRKKRMPGPLADVVSKLTKMGFKKSSQRTDGPHVYRCWKKVDGIQVSVDAMESFEEVTLSIDINP